MLLEAVATERRSGRPSHYPVPVKYHEDAGVNALMQHIADREGMSFAEVQRAVNRAGIRALRLGNA